MDSIIIEWNDNFNTNVVKIDEQHQILIELYNKFIFAYLQDKELEILYEVFSELLNYTKFHFNEEEGIMTSINYPDIESHKILHKDLLSSVNTLFEEFKLGNTKISVEVVNFLRDWLMNHIAIEDKRIGVFANSN
jgi:hemerythrin